MSQKALTKSAKAMAVGLHSITKQYQSGGIGIEDWYDDAYAQLYKGHLAAWTIGRSMSGDKSAQSTEDEVEARRIADYQTQYLDRFRDDLESNRYENNPDAALSRGDLYALSIRGTASEAWVGACDEDDDLKWRLGDSEHCDDCIDLASRKYTAATLYAYPGDGSTVCGGHCNCHLVRGSDGLESPKRISLD